MGAVGGERAGPWVGRPEVRGERGRSDSGSWSVVLLADTGLPKEGPV